MKVGKPREECSTNMTREEHAVEFDHNVFIRRASGWFTNASSPRELSECFDVVHYKYLTPHPSTRYSLPLAVLRSLLLKNQHYM